MIYQIKPANPDLDFYVKSYWSIEDDNTAPYSQKIIPDGYPELIFHYRDPYRANINGTWENQKHGVLAGQITTYFHLENTGKSGMFAIKFQPWTLKLLFDIDIKPLTNQAISFDEYLTSIFKELIKISAKSISFDEKIAQVDKWLIERIKNSTIKKPLAISCAKDIIQSYGDISISELLKKYSISERSLERQFLAYIGLTPKRYARVIRFARIFKLVQEDQKNWAEISYNGGYYDQSHFIKNFKEFTGEDPTKYGFDEKNMANFFLK